MAPPRKPVVKRYRFEGEKLLHRARAERALGKPLPPGAVVHHADGSKGDDAPLVICQDTAYHGLLHVRMRVKAAGGDPNRHRICSQCRQITAVEDMGKQQPSIGHKSQYASQCKACIRDRANRWYASKKARVA